MNNLILENGFSQRRHRQYLTLLLASTKGILRVASAYVTDRDLLISALNRERRLLISLLPMDIASGATSIETLGALIKSGVNCRGLPARPRLHAKVYIFGKFSAVITSANLTGSALDSNIEAGVEVNPDQVDQVTAWFDRLWKKATPLTLGDLSEWQKNTRKIRNEFMKLKNKANAKLQEPVSDKPKDGFSDLLLDLFETAEQYFVCNSNRKHSPTTEIAGCEWEEKMLNRGFAAAWEPFKFRNHMEQVKRGDVVFMFAKGVGVIGIGTAKDECERLLPNHPGRIRDIPDKTECRVPIQWLHWFDEASAFRWNEAPNFTFWNVSEARYNDFREEVKVHFLHNS